MEEGIKENTEEVKEEVEEKTVEKKDRKLVYLLFGIVLVCLFFLFLMQYGIKDNNRSIAESELAEYSNVMTCEFLNRERMLSSSVLGEIDSLKFVCFGENNTILTIDYWFGSKMNGSNIKFVQQGVG